MISAHVRLMRLLTATGLILAAAHSVQAQVFYDWTNASGDSNYFNAANWGLPTSVVVNGVTTWPTNASGAAPSIPGATAQIRLTGSSAYASDTRTLNMAYKGTGDATYQIWGLQTGVRSAYTMNLSGTANGWLNYDIVGRGATPYYADLVALQTVANTGSTATRLPFTINLGSYSRIVFDNSTSAVGGSTSGLAQAAINMTGNAQMDLSQAGNVAYTYNGTTTTPKAQVEVGELNMAAGTSVYLGLKGIASFEGMQAAGVTDVLAGRIYADAANVQIFQKWGTGITDMTGVMDLGNGGFSLRTGIYLVDGVHNGTISTNIASGSTSTLGGRGTINYIPTPVYVGTVPTYTPAVNMGIRSFLAPGGVGTGGTLTINGNVTLNAPLSVTLYGPTNFGQLVVNGNLTLGATTGNTSSLAVGISSTFPLFPGTYRILNVNPNSNMLGSTGNIYNGVTSVAGAPTTVGAAFNSVSLPISQGLQASYVLGSNYIDVTFTQLAFATNPLLSGNHLIIADHIDKAVLAGGVPLQFLDTLNRQPSVILFRNLLDQLSPAVYYGWYPSAVMRSHAMTQTVQDRLDQDTKERTKGSWDTYTLTSRQESSVAATNLADYTNFDTVSILTGVDYLVTPQLKLGGLVDYSDTHYDLDTWGSVSRSDSYTGSLYAQYKQGPWRVQAIGFAGYDGYTAQRTVGLTLLANAARAKTKGNRFGGGVSGSYTITFPWFEVTPNVSLDTLYWTADGFREKDAAEVSLSVRSQAEMLLSSRAGVRISQSYPVKNGFIRPFINITSQHQFNSGVRTIKADLFGSVMSVKTNGLRANGVRYDAGLDWDVTRRFSLQVRYSSETSGVVDESMGVRGGLNLAF